MSKTIDYYFTPVSPWTHLGHERLRAMAREHGAVIRPKPVDFGRIFSVSGGVPLKQRPLQRQAYRMFELARWRDHLGIPIVLEPKFFPAASDLAAKAIIAAAPHGANKQLDIAGAILRACWEEERNVADPATLEAIGNAHGIDGAALLAAAAAPAAQSTFDALTQEAIDHQVFGAPTYLIDGEPFWGQDRLEFVARKLTA
jgi:2-hydroxychromene-2-carboxylate isomerase